MKQNSHTKIGQKAHKVLSSRFRGHN